MSMFRDWRKRITLQRWATPRQSLSKLVLDPLEDRLLLSFLPTTIYGTAPGPDIVAVADLNNDGHQDVVTANFSSGTVSVLLGNGDGTFQNARNYSTGAGTEGVAVGDFDEDGNMDLVATNFASGTVSILLGNGDGTFRPGRTINIASPLGVVAEDLGNGHTDIVVTSFVASGKVSVLLGNGDDTFAAPVPYAVGNGPISLIATDLRGTGVLDLAVTNRDSNNVSILLGNGDGTFLPAVNYSTGGRFTLGVAAGDINQDGAVDLVVAGAQSDTVSVLLGTGDGTFAAGTPVRTAANSGPSYVVLADFDGDGILDLGVSNQISNTVAVALGNGDGTFQALSSFTAGHQPIGLAQGDFNEDSLPDLVAAATQGNHISVFINDGNWSPGGAPSGSGRDLAVTPARSEAPNLGFTPQVESPALVEPSTWMELTNTVNWSDNSTSAELWGYLHHGSRLPWMEAFPAPDSLLDLLS